MPAFNLSKEAVVGTAALGMVAVAGFLIGRRYSGLPFGTPKSRFRGKNSPLLQYVLDHSLREHPALKKLRLVTWNLPNKNMMVSIDEAQLLANLARLIKAKKVIEARVDHKIDLRIKPAIQTLDELLANGEAATFDFAFIDANKDGYNDYYERCLQLVRKGGIIAIDNVLWSGRVLKPAKGDLDGQHLHQLNEKIFRDPRVNISMLTIGDGVTLAFKL
ncbi:catechol O-methyltransferase domain-containing protein 1 isoform X2 [Podarcis raffonei]|uniref:catechol O-methyltransferase domain-containing protein 1 isoform X2 n=1 Tax=Podarcis raffonei TaxID=65483 RepID=UPI00232956E8|nr:catechol O-methyltransferase domain-containing protein 1 isoform X2 [Podarcis raffonei]